MSGRITPDDVTHVAKLARLDLKPEEVQQYVAQFDSILEHFEDIDELDLDQVQPMTQPYPLVNVFRDDVPGPCLDRDEVLAMAPSAVDRRFEVPSILGEAP